MKATDQRKLLWLRQAVKFTGCALPEPGLGRAREV